MNQPAASPSDESPGTPTREEVIQLLDSEIEIAREKIQRPGWSRWAVLGSLAAIAWVFVDQIEGKTLSLPSVSLIVLLGYFIIETLQALHVYAEILGVNWAALERDRYRSVGAMIHDNPKALATIAMLVALLAVAVMNRGEVGRIPFLVAMIHLGMKIVFEILAFALSLRTVPFGVGFFFDNRRVLPISALLQIAVAGIIAYGYAPVLQQANPTWLDLRIAMLLVASSFLFGLLLETPSTAPLIDELIALRRGLVFRRVAVAECMKRAEILLDGARVEEFFQQEIKLLLDMQNQASDDCADLEVAWRLFETRVLDADASGIETPVPEGILKIHSEAEGAVKSARRASERLKKTASWAEFLAPGVRAALEVVTMKVNLQLDEVSARLKAFREKIGLSASE